MARIPKPYTNNVYKYVQICRSPQLPKRSGKWKHKIPQNPLMSCDSHPTQIGQYIK